MHPGKITALEMGAGTGIFTKRLAMLGEIEIVALEIDWACYKALESNIKKTQSDYQLVSDTEKVPHEYSTTIRFPKLDAKVKIIAQDSRIYNTPRKFRYIFSSFADHHILPEDKAKYFSNMVQNLEPDGIIIVGDEFLPEYPRDEDTPFKAKNRPAKAKEEALYKYHNHIISIAEQQGYRELVALEQAALDSGLQGHGDFKLSCNEYQQLIKEANLIWEKVKIGPKNRDDVGGVYVYTLRVKDAASGDG